MTHPIIADRLFAKRVVEDVYEVAKTRWPACSVWWDGMQNEGYFACVVVEIPNGGRLLFPPDRCHGARGSEVLLNLLRWLVDLDDPNPEAE